MRNKKTVLIIAIVLAIAIAVMFTILAFTVWKTKEKTTQDWLNDFKNSLVIQKNDSEQKMEKSIVITEDGTEVARYYQLVEIKNQNDSTVAHLSVSEEFPTLETREFDYHDEYYFIDGKMHMQRTTSDETSGTSFTSNWETFWEVASENIGSVDYNFSESLFTDLLLGHENGLHTLSASIAEDHKSLFFTDAENLDDMSLITVMMSMNSALQLQEFTIHYMYQDNQDVVLNIVSSEPTEIEIRDFVQSDH